MDERYWIIDYEIDFLSDFHIGAGINLLGGNTQGLRLDEREQPFIPHTEIRGLLRLGGQRLKDWQSRLGRYFERNFGAADNSGIWSYTSARFSGKNRFHPDIFQAHMHETDNGEKRLFSFQKAGSSKGEKEKMQGRIYSTVKTGKSDVNFMVLAMRAEDRIGLRRSRGYGRVDWKVSTVSAYKSGNELENIEYIDVFRSRDQLATLIEEL